MSLVRIQAAPPSNYLSAYISIVFQDRLEAGRLLAKKLNNGLLPKHCALFAIPRGGIVVAQGIVELLHYPLYPFFVKKISVPANQELAIGAVAEGGGFYVDYTLVQKIGLSKKLLKSYIEGKRRELKNEQRIYSTYKKRLPKNIQTIILTDDGVATGATVFAAFASLKEKILPSNTKVRILLAVPVIAKETLEKVQSCGMRVVSLEVPESFSSVGEFYKEFSQVEDHQAMHILSTLNRRGRL